MKLVIPAKAGIHVPLIYLLPLYLLTFYVVNLKQKTDVHSTKQVTEKTIPSKSMESLKEECPHCLKFSGEEEDLELEPESELLQQCAVDLCGPANKNPEYVLNNNTFDNEDTELETAKRFSRMIQPSVEEALQAKRDYNKDVLSILQDKLEDPESNMKPQEWDEIAEALSMKIAMDNVAADMPTDSIKK